MKKTIAIVSLFLSFIFSQNSYACEIELEGLDTCAEIKWLQGPKYGIFSKIQVTYFKKDDKAKNPVNPSTEIEVYPWMIMDGGMEHGARDTVTKQISTGVFEVNFIQFMKMDGGYWEMRFKKKGTHSKTHAIAKTKVELPK